MGFKDVGIEFTMSDDYDYAWIGQASIIDKEVSLNESIDKGIDFVSTITGDYFIVDGPNPPLVVGYCIFLILNDNAAVN